MDEARSRVTRRSYQVQVVWNAGRNFEDVGVVAVDAKEALRKAREWADEHLTSSERRWADFVIG